MVESLEEWVDGYLVNLRDNPKLVVDISEIKSGRVRESDKPFDYDLIHIRRDRKNSLYWVNIKDDFIPLLLMIEKYWNVQEVVLRSQEGKYLYFLNSYLSTLTKDRLSDYHKIDSIFIIVCGVKIGLKERIRRLWR